MAARESALRQGQQALQLQNLASRLETALQPTPAKSSTWQRFPAQNRPPLFKGDERREGIDHRTVGRPHALGDDEAENARKREAGDPRGQVVLEIRAARTKSALPLPSAAARRAKPAPKCNQKASVSALAPATVPALARLTFTARRKPTATRRAIGSILARSGNSTKGPETEGTSERPQHGAFCKARNGGPAMTGGRGAAFSWRSGILRLEDPFWAGTCGADPSRVAKAREFWQRGGDSPGAEVG